MAVVPSFFVYMIGPIIKVATTVAKSPSGRNFTNKAIDAAYRSRIGMLANKPLRKGEELASDIAARIVHQKAKLQDMNKVRDKYGFLIKRK